MGLGSVFLILALMLLVGLVVSRPFLENSKPIAQKDDPYQLEHKRSTLMAERDRLLRALKELDFDYALGKIPEEDYPSQRKLLLQKGVDILRKLDEIQPGEGTQEFDLQLEAAIAAHRVELEDLSHAPNGNGRKPLSRIAGAVVASPEDDLEVLLANRRRDRRDKATGFCPKCGAPHQKSDLFCPKCGAKVSISEA
jgi:hypothetical protein